MKNRSTWVTAGLFLGLGLALAGCGKRGPLELPSGEKAQMPTDESSMTLDAPESDQPIDMRPITADTSMKSNPDDPAAQSN
ncbi:lipoprotein [Parvibaculum sp.]|jgi:predicted small lipoprotein YifL|uniref:LPS translocon maturation chaperone LptM n=1 Tax=Parvibaculum sp. TaxID=2024848 RepID=UPI000C911BD2|nr:lipoprotein [Parvibaculum sp.]MAB14493.1 hypothetical protein [Parvibaculum sp.]